MKEIDARGYDCPMPVIMAKRYIDKNLNEFIIYVDNKIATENLKIMADEVGYELEILEEEQDKYKVTFKKSIVKHISDSKKQEDFIIVIDSDTLGTGDKELGNLLMENYIFTLTEQEELPKYILLYNSGVFLTTTNNKTAINLSKLSELGVEILSCGLCLDYYDLLEELKTGSVTNMYRIVKLMSKYRVISL